MPFLSVSGVTVPILTGQASRNIEDIGRATRGVTGQLSKDRRFVKRRFEFKTAPMSLADYATLRGLLHLNPVSFRFENSLTTNLQTGALTVTTSAANYAASVAADGTAVLGLTAYGNYALLPGGLGTNLWGGNLSNGSESTQTAFGMTAIGTATIASSTLRYWRGTRSFSLATTGAGSGLRTVAYAPTASKSYAASFFITGTAQPVLCELYGNATLLASATITPAANAWQRVKLIAGSLIAPGTTDLYLKVTQSGATAGTYYLDGLQLEMQSFVTPWMDTSRNAISSIIIESAGATNLFGTKEGFSVSARVQRLTVPGGTICQVANNQGYNNEPYPGLVLGAVVLVGQTVTHSGTTPGVVVTTDAQTSVAVAPASPLNWGSDDTAFHQITAVVAPRPMAGRPSIALYFDGVLAGSSTADLTGLSAEKMQRLCLGSHGVDFPFAAPLDDVAVFPFPLSPQAVLGLYQAGQVNQAWPVQSLSGTALPFGAVDAIGEIQKAEFVAARINGTMQNAVQLGLTFMER